MNKKGQALVEFIIILPVMIYLLLAIVDFGTYTFNKNKMEGLLSNVNNMYLNNETNEEINNYIHNVDSNISCEIISNEKYSTIKLNKKYKIITPGLEKIVKLSDISVERIVYNE